MKRYRSHFLIIPALLLAIGGAVFIIFSADSQSHVRFDSDIHDADEFELNVSSFPNSLESPVESAIVSDSPDVLPPFVTKGNSEVIVYNFSDLKSALSEANGYSHIFLGDDIVMTSGITVNSSKTHITIDGINPLEPEKGAHTLTEFSSAAIDGAIYIANSSTKSAILKNINIVGKNFYGTISVSALYAVDITYENIDYTGPQIAYNTKGTCRFIDCNINVTTSNGSPSLVEELSQARDVVFGGTVTVTGSSNVNSLMWFMGSGGSLSVLDSASVTINIHNGYMIYSDSKVACSIGTDARFTVNSRFGLFFSNSALLHQFSTLDIAPGAVFEVYQSQRNALSPAPTVKISEKLNVCYGARFIVYVDHSPSEPLIRFMSDSAGAVFDNPDSVILANNGGSIFDWFTGSGTVDMTGDAFSFWTDFHSLHDVAGFSIMPSRFWYKNTNQPINITVTASSASTIDVTSNINPVEDFGVEITTQNFAIKTARILAFGQFPLELDKPAADSVVLTGTTIPNAQLRLEHSHFGTMDGDASGGGLICVYVPGFDYPGSVLVHAQNGYLYKSASVEVEPANDISEKFLSFSHVPSVMPFGIMPISTGVSIFTRAVPDWTIILYDSRDIGAEWSLYVCLLSPLMRSDGKTIENAVVLDGQVLDNGILKAASGIKVSSEQSVKIKWSSSEGVLLRILPGSVFAGRYTASLQWSLIDGP